MWIWSLEWLLLALLIFWVTGALKRFKRLSAGIKQAFAPVESQLAELIALLRDCARMQEIKDRVNSNPLTHVHLALMPCADLLEVSLERAARQPLQPETIAALGTAWEGAQVAWQTYVQQSEAYAQAQATQDAALQECQQRWLHMVTLYQHSAEQFNPSVLNYNRAITQFPASVVARIRGLQTVRPLHQDAAQQMQLTHDA